MKTSPDNEDEIDEKQTRHLGPENKQKETNKERKSKNRHSTVIKSHIPPPPPFGHNVHSSRRIPQKHLQQDSPRKAVGEMMPVRLATTIAMPVSRKGTVKSSTSSLSELILMDVIIISAFPLMMAPGKPVHFPFCIATPHQRHNNVTVPSGVRRGSSGQADGEHV